MMRQCDRSALLDRALWLAAGTLLRICRQVRGWEQEELAWRAGVSLGAVARAELGLMSHPDLDLWRRLTAGLDLELDPFLTAAADRAGISLLVADPALPPLILTDAVTG